MTRAFYSLLAIFLVLAAPAQAALVADPGVLYQQMKDAYAKGDAAVSLRLLRALSDIAISAPAELSKSLVAMGRRVVAGCAERLGADEMRSLRARLETLEKSAGLPQ